MAGVVLSTIESFNLNICNLRGQSYDNASNMSGIYSGLQAKIKAVSPLAQFVPCSAHSLNLVGINAASSCKNAVMFFDLLQKLYTFFSVSTYRWDILKSSVKSLSDTRWSARDDACKSLNNNWKLIINALENLKNDKSQKPATRCEANGILQKLLSLETAFMSILWGHLLERFNLSSKRLQSVDMDLVKVAEIYQSLIFYVIDLRTDSEYEHYKKLAIEKCGIEDFASTMKRTKKRKKFIDDGPATDGSNAIDFKVTTYLAILDRIQAELIKRKNAYDELNKKYQFLFCITEMTSMEVREKAAVLQQIYQDDLGKTFPNECVHFRAHMLSLKKMKKIVPGTAQDLLTFIKVNNLIELYPYVDIALRMLLCTPSSNCSAERSFSALKRVKNYLRSTIGMERLNSLAMLNIECKLTNELQYDDIIDEFANQQARKKL